MPQEANCATILCGRVMSKDKCLELLRYLHHWARRAVRLGVHLRQHGAAMALAFVRPIVEPGLDLCGEECRTILCHGESIGMRHDEHAP